jgi:hypothetical protein
MGFFISKNLGEKENQSKFKELIWDCRIYYRDVFSKDGETIILEGQVKKS